MIVQNFLPKPGTSMHRHPPCPTDEFLWTIAAARLLLPADVHLQAPPNLSDELGPLVAAGIDDWGGVSPVTADHVNPERAWPALGILRAATEAAGHTLAPRLTIYPEFALDPARWLDGALRFPVLDASDAEGLGRDHPWASGGEVPPPELLPPATGGGSPAPRESVVDRLRRRCRRRGAGRGPGRRDGGRGRDRHPLRRPGTRGTGRGRRRRPAAARHRGRRGHLRRQPEHQLHQRVHVQVQVLRVLQGTAVAQPARRPYLLELGEITDRVAEAEAMGATEVCLQGGSTRTSTASTTCT